jgi:hypothetical protein
MARGKHDAVARGERAALCIHFDVPARRLLDKYAPGPRSKGAFISRLLHEHEAREEMRALMERESAAASVA